MRFTKRLLFGLPLAACAVVLTSSLPALAQSLEAHWKLNESSGTSAADSSGNGHTGTVTGTASWTAGMINNCFSFNGATKIQAAGLLGNSANITVAAWANLTSADTSGAEIISLGDHFGLRLDQAGGTNAFFYNGSTWVVVNLSQTFAGTGWHHFVATFDDASNSFQLYVDGALAASTFTTSSISYSGLGSNTVIGRHGNANTNMDFNGKIDDVRVYDYALSATEILDLYSRIAHWKLDETSGTTVSDSSVSVAHAAFSSGAPTWITGVRGNALLFDGVDDAADTDAAFAPPATGTVAFWFQSDGATAARERLFGVNSNWEAWQGVDGRIRFDLGFDGDNAGFTTSASLTQAGRWYHIAAIFDQSAGSYQLYVDGALDVSGSATVTTQSAAVLSLGTRTGSTERLSGALDDFRIYNRTLSASEVAQLHGLVGHWKLTETSGTSAADATLVANNGTYTNGVTLNASGPYPGLGSKAASFDGTNDYVAVANESNYDITEHLTVAAWIRVTAFDANYQAIVVKGISSWRLTRNSTQNTLRLACNGLSTTSVTGVTPVDDGQWHHVAGVYDGSSLTLYVDGQLEDSVGATGSISTNDVAVAIGRYIDSSGTEWNGLIHDVRVYNRALSAAEVAELHGLVGSWMLSDTSGTTATDSSLTGNNGTYTNGVTLNTAGPKSGLVAAQFDGVNDYVTAPTQADLSKGCSIAVWARPTAANSWARFADFGAGTADNNVFLNRNGTSNTLDLAIHDGSGGSNTYVQASNAIELNKWHHYAGTVDSTGQAKLYVDGVEVALTSGSAGYPNIGVPSNVIRNSNYIARSNWVADAYYQGKMWDMRLYNRPLSAAEVQLLFEGGSFAGVKIITWVEIQ